MRSFHSSDYTGNIAKSDTSYFRNILKSILTSGMAGKAGLGWILEYEDGVKSVFRIPFSYYFLVTETEDTVTLTVCLDDYVSNYSFSERTHYKLMPTIYQAPEGLVLNKTSLLDEWHSFGTDKFFYFISGQLVIFFGFFRSFHKIENAALICSTNFDDFESENSDHLMAKSMYGLTNPSYLTKTTFFGNIAPVEMSNLYLRDPASNRMAGLLPNAWVPNSTLELEDGTLVLTSSKRLLCKKFNNKSIMFDLNG